MNQSIFQEIAEDVADLCRADLHKETHYISRTAQRLLADRELMDLDKSEFMELLHSFNSVGARLAGFVTSAFAVLKYPDDLELARRHSSNAAAYLGTDRYRAHLDKLIACGTSLAPFWHLCIAAYLIGMAWGPDEEMLGTYPEDPSYLPEASRVLALPGVREFYDQWCAQDGLLGYTLRPFTFEEWFDGVLRFPEASHLQK